MKKYCLIVLLIFVVIAGRLRAENVEYEIESGKYNVELNLTKRSLRSMPIPKSNSNYALLQSLDTTCNIVIGNFATDERRITLLKDRNSDGTVDYVAHWFIDLKKYDVEKEPGKYCPPEKFKQMKSEIFDGKTGSISPNPEGTAYLDQLLAKETEVRRWYYGYRIIEYDIDSKSKSRVVYFFSDNKNRGVDIVVTVNYRYEGIVHMVPTITQGIYCKNSKDSYIRQRVQEMIAKAKQKVKK